MYKAYLYATGIALISQSCVSHTSLNMLENRRQADELKQSEYVDMLSNEIRSKSVDFCSPKKSKCSSGLSSNEKCSDESTALSHQNLDTETHKHKKNPKGSESVEPLVNKVVNALDNASTSVDDLADIIGNNPSEETKNALKKKLQEYETELHNALIKCSGFENENLIHFSIVGLDQPKQENTLPELQSIYTKYVKCVFVQGCLDQDYWLYDRLQREVCGIPYCLNPKLTEYLAEKEVSSLQLDWFKWFKMAPEGRVYLQGHASWLKKHGGEKGKKFAQELRDILKANKEEGTGPWGEPSTLYYSGSRPDSSSTDSLDEEGYSSEDDVSDSEWL